VVSFGLFIVAYISCIVSEYLRDKGSGGVLDFFKILATLNRFVSNRFQKCSAAYQWYV